MFKFVLGLLVGLLCVIFFAQNGEAVSVDFLTWTINLPLYLLMILILFSGIFLGWLSAGFSKLRKSRRKKSL